MSFVTNFVKDLTGASAAEKGAKYSAKGLKLQEQQYADEKAFQALLDQLLGTAKASGQWDVDSRVASYDKEWGKGLDRALISEGAAQRIAGVKPGDSTPQRRLDEIAARGANQRTQDVEKIRWETIMDEIRAKMSTRNPGTAQTGQNLAGGYQNTGNQYYQAGAQQGAGFTSLLGASMPYWLKPRSGTAVA